MPNSNPRDGFFYQHLVPTQDTHITSFHYTSLLEIFVRATPYCARSTLDIVVQVRYSMVRAPVRPIIPSLKLGDYLSVQAYKPCSSSHVYNINRYGTNFLTLRVAFPLFHFLHILFLCRGPFLSDLIFSLPGLLES